MRTFVTRTRARFAETDASGIVYYANYLIYFELGRLDMFRALGLPYDRRVPIRETHCRYHAPARSEEELEIHTFVEEVRARAFRTGARVYRVSDGAAPELLAEGWTVMVTTDEERRPAPLPDAFREAFARLGAG